MTTRRIFFLKCALGLFILFVLIHVMMSPQTVRYIRVLQQSGENLASLENQPQSNNDVQSQAQVQQKVVPGDQKEEEDKKVEEVFDARRVILNNDVEDVNLDLESAKVDNEEEKEGMAVVDVVPSELVPIVQSVVDRVRNVTACIERPQHPKTQQRGDYWVLYNYIPSDRHFSCSESITYTTHADYTFLDNLIPLVERWRGPISIAVHAPGSDFEPTLESIAYLRECSSDLVRELVTWHLYFSTRHVPKEVPRHQDVLTFGGQAYNCSQIPPFAQSSPEGTYKAQKKLLYPVNVGRNVARESASTHYILPSDIELYPSPNIIQKFLAMIAENKGSLTSPRPKVFPLHLFEIAANQSVPETKTALQEMLRSNTALPFHKKLCPGCHNVPKAKEWQQTNETEGLHIFHVGKRNGYFIHWEPIFIGTHVDPLYDERLSWEGKSDKMTQGYALCVLDYDFLILDNAFLVHKPGIKVYKKDPRRAQLSSKTNQLIRKIIFPELKVMYGTRKGCAV